MESGQDVGIQQIPANVYRSEERVTISAPMPGLEPQNIHVEVRDNNVVLHGDLRGALKGDKEILMDEWTPGPYHREIELPQGVDGQRANVTYNNGVLVISLPVAETTTTASLTLETVSPTQGERVGNTGRNTQPPGNESGPGEATTSYTSGETI